MNDRKDTSLQIMAVGDIMMGSAYFHSLVNDSIPNRLTVSGEQLIDDDVIDILNEADLLFGNLESVISDNFNENENEIPPKLMAPVESMSVLERAGFDVLNLANNHILDHGPACVEETVTLLNSKGINSIGNPLKEEKGLCLERRGQNICFLGYYLLDLNDEVARKTVTSAVKARNDSNSLTIVSLHWGVGTEHMRHPSPEQVSFARNLIELGADIILGHHSHTFQPIETYDGGLIAYSLGNFIFDMWRKENRASGILKITIDKNRTISSEVIPIEQQDYQVKKATDDFMREVLMGPVAKKSPEEYHMTARKVRRNHRIEVVQQYISNCYKFPMNYHISTWKRWMSKVIDETFR